MEMTKPLTPREKVAAVMIATGVNIGSSTWPDEIQVDALTLADAGIFSLASGSGDHAELARSAEEALLPMPEKRRKSWFNRQNRFRDTASPATVLALLAENAALRERGGRLNELCRRFHDQVASQSTRATEAERKLAEAVGLLGPFAEAADCLEDRARDTDHIWEQPAAMCISAGQLRAIRTFLSKEAERDKL